MVSRLFCAVQGRSNSETSYFQAVDCRIIGAKSLPGQSGHMGRADIERAVRQLAGRPARDRLLATLTEVRKRLISTRPGLEEFVRQGGLFELVGLLKELHPAEVFNLALSILGNCTTRPAGRQHFVQHGGLHAVLNVIQIVADPEVANRGCRTLANLAREPPLCRVLHQEDTLEVATGLLAAEPPPSDELRLTIFRFWRTLADTGSHQRRLLRSECLVTVAAALASENRHLVREAVRTLTHFAGPFARETGAQMQQAPDALAALLRLCGAGEAAPPPPAHRQLGPAALQLALALARESSLRPPLGRLGFLRLLHDGARRPADGRQAATLAACQEAEGGVSCGKQAQTEPGRTPPGATAAAAAAAAEDDTARSEGVDGPTGRGCDIQPSSRTEGGWRAARPESEPGQGRDDGGTPTETASDCFVTSAVDRTSLISVLCLFCWESVNRARLRSLGYLPWLVSLLDSDRQPEWLKRRVLHALFQFVYDEAGFAQMKSAGLIAVLVGRLQTLVAGWRAAAAPASPARLSSEEDADDGDGSGAESPAAFRADSPTYRQVEREIEAYLQQVRRAAPPAERLCKAFSPTDSLASSPWRSPDVSPPSWPLSGSPASASPSWSTASSCPSQVSPAGGPFSPPVSPTDGPFSPAEGPCSPADGPFSPAGGPFSPQSGLPPAPSERGQWSPPAPESPAGPSSPRVPEPRSVRSRQATPGSPNGRRKRRRSSSEATAPATGRGGDEEDWLLLLLSRESQSERPDARLAGADSCAALVDYMRFASRPQARASRVLARLCRNPHCFRSLVSQRLAWQCVSRLTEEQAAAPLDSLRTVAESGYGQGVLESLLEVGGGQAVSAATTAAIVVSLQTSLRRLLVRRGGLDLLLAGLGSGGERAELAGGALLALGQRLVPAERAPAPAPAPAGPRGPCLYAAEPAPADVTLVLADGEVAARRGRLAAGGPVLAALLTGAFREASSQRVALGELRHAVAVPLVHLVYGCRRGCRLLDRLPAVLWLELLAAADRFLLVEPAELLGGRVLAAQQPAQLTALYRAAKRLPLELEGAGRLDLHLLCRLLAAGPRRAAAELRRLLRHEGDALVADLRSAVTQLLEPSGH